MTITEHKTSGGSCRIGLTGTDARQAFFTLL
jgi:hypothetical protein